MKLFTLVTLLIILLPFNSYAHKDHGAHSQTANISQEQAILIAIKKVSEQVESNELESSWNSVISKTAVLERVNGRQVWKVSLSQLIGTTTEVLNVFVTRTGEFVSASK